MRDNVPVVAPAVSRAEALARCADLGGKIRDGEVLVEQTQSALAGWRLEVGKALIALRATFTTRGDGFVDCVEHEAKIAHSTAQRYMEAAGYVARPSAPIKPDMGSIGPVQGAKAGMTGAVLPSQRIRQVPSANLPTPRPPALAPIVHREASRTIRGDSQVAPSDGEPVYQLDESEEAAPARAAPRQLAFDWAGTAAAVKREVARAGVDEAAALVTEMCERVPGLRRVLLAQLGGGAA